MNEAFAAQALAVSRELGLPPERTNPNGSGVSLGHPIGATGTILTVKALYELRRTGGRYALVTMCIGGGGHRRDLRTTLTRPGLAGSPQRPASPATRTARHGPARTGTRSTWRCP